ncbi:MAG: metallophosphoesterase [Candidatus Thorarchaeota archaeon]
MSFLSRKKQAFNVEDVEAYLKDHQSIEFAGSGDPHEEKGKIRLLLDNLKTTTPDILLFDGDYLAEPAYLKAGVDQAEIAEASIAILKDILGTLQDCEVPSYCVAGNYEMFGTTADAVEEIGSDQIFDVGCDKTADSINDRIHPDDTYMDLQSLRTTWPGGLHEKSGFAFIGVEGSNPINQTFPGERSEDNLRWAIEQTLSKVNQESKDIIIATHSPPFGMRDRLGRFGVPPHLWGAQKGSVALREMADARRPFMILVGHIHEAFGAYISVKSMDNAGEPVEEAVDIDFGNRSKITIGYDTSKTSVTITLNKGTLEYWNWSRVRIAEEGNQRIVDIEGEWLDRKGRKKPFKKFSQILDYDDVLATRIG